MKNVLRGSKIFAVLTAVVLTMPFEGVFAAKTEMSQRILPVTFVYLGKNKTVIDTWSNVSTADNLYVLKFFDASKKNEIPLTDDLMAVYVNNEMSSKKNFDSQIVQFRKENGILNQIVTVT